MDKLEYIVEKLKTEKIFIELIGTPKSGKTSLMPYIQSFFLNKGINCMSYSEVTEKNPIKKGSKYYILK